MHIYRRTYINSECPDILYIHYINAIMILYIIHCTLLYKSVNVDNSYCTGVYLAILPYIMHVVVLHNDAETL